MMFNKLGEELKEAREKGNIPLKQVATETRIDLKFLEALEQGNFSFLPELYVKAFLKEYASYVGLNVNTIIKKYEYARQGKMYEEKPEAAETPPAPIEQGKPLEPAKPVKQEVIKKEEPKPVLKYAQPLQTYDSIPQEQQNDEKAAIENRKKLIFAGLIAGTILVIAAIYFLIFNNSSDIIVPETAADEEVLSETRKYFEDEQPAAEEYKDTTVQTYAAAPGDSMKLNVFASDTSWVKITVDDNRIEEFFLMPNSQKSFNASANYTIIFGRSSAIKLTLNDKPLSFSPKNKFVSKISVDSAGIKYLDLTPAAKQGDQ